VYERFAFAAFLVNCFLDLARLGGGGGGGMGGGAGGGGGGVVESGDIRREISVDLLLMLFLDPGRS